MPGDGAHTACSGGSSAELVIRASACAARPRTTGAPRLLTISVQQEPEQADRDRLPAADAHGCRNSTSAPSRTPRPLNDSGSTCSIETAGTYASVAASGTGRSSVRKIERDGEHDRELVHDRGAEHGDRLPGLAPEAVDADVHRADELGPVLVFGEAAGDARDGRRGTARAPGRTSVMPAMSEREPRAVDVDERRPERRTRGTRAAAARRTRSAARARPIRTRSATSRPWSRPATPAARRRRSSTAARCRRTGPRGSARSAGGAARRASKT